MYLYINKRDSAGDIMCGNFGYYIVGDKFFFSQVKAYEESNKSKKPIQHRFYDEVFEEAHKKGLWKDLSLQTLYTQRAIQLRQTYDVVAINFSGGWDSRNMLDSFEAAGCHVDFIVIQSVKELEDKGIQNSLDPGNWITEITNVAIPYAKEFCQRNPNTKIIVIDGWFSKVLDDFDSNKDNLDHIFLQAASKPGIMYNRNISIQHNQEFMKSIEGGKHACLLAGLDKPIISHVNYRSAQGHFPESILSRFKIPRTSAGYDEHIIHENFYWTPFLPEIAIRGWYEMYLLVFKDKNFAIATNLATPHQYRTDMFLSLGVQNSIKKVIYPNYDAKVWTVGKPRDWGFLFTLEIPLIKILDSCRSNWREKLLELFSGIKHNVGDYLQKEENKVSLRQIKDTANLIGDDRFFFKYKPVNQGPGISLDLDYILTKIKE